MRLGGWLRLWVVLGVLWGLLVAFVAYDSRPKIESVRSAWIYDATEAIAAKVTEAEGQHVSGYEVRDSFGKKYPTSEQMIAWLEQIERKPKLSQVIFRDEVIAINAEHRRKLAEHPSDVRVYALKAFLFWLTPLLFVLALGYSIGWVWRGFRPRAST